jgi:hypothetical protein
MGLSVHVQGLDGLRVIPSTDPQFDTLATPLLGRISEIVLKLKPMLVLVSNESNEKVVSFSKTWRVTHHDGRTSTSRDHTSFPESVCGDVCSRRQEINLAPGAIRIEAHGVVIHGWKDGDPYYDQFLPQFVEEKEQLLADAATLQIELSAAIFADGTLVGPDEGSWLEELFSTYVGAKQKWYREIIAALDSGQSVQDAFGPLDRFLKESGDRRHSERRSYAESPVDFWTEVAASDAAVWRHEYADEEIPRLFREAIRVEPFVIRRRS